MSRDSLFLIDLFVGFMGFVTTGQLICGILAFCFMYFYTLGIPEWMIPKKETDDITEVNPCRVSESFLNVPDYRMAKALREGAFREYIEKDPEKYRNSDARESLRIGLNYKTENQCHLALQREDCNEIFMEFYEKYIVDHPEYATEELDRMWGEHQVEKIVKKIYKDFSTPEEIKAAKIEACKEILSNLDKYKMKDLAMLYVIIDEHYNGSLFKCDCEIPYMEYKSLCNEFVSKDIVKDTP